MAIVIEVEDYCQNCLHFEADVKSPERLYGSNETGGLVIQSDTIVRCRNRKQCEYLMRYLKKQTD